LGWSGSLVWFVVLGLWSSWSKRGIRFQVVGGSILDRGILLDLSGVRGVHISLVVVNGVHPEIVS
jgi:hypothetical protein